jgi:hypothetical protein
MYWHLKNLHNETISRKKVQQFSRNFEKFREIKITFVVISHFAKYKNPISLQPYPRAEIRLLYRQWTARYNFEI